MATRVPSYVVWKQAGEHPTERHQAFYRKFRQRLLDGDPVDIGDNDGYLAMFRAECVEVFHTDEELALQMIGRLREAYPELDCLSAEHIESEMRMLRGEWVEAFDLARLRVQTILLTSMPDEVGHPRLEHWRFWRSGRNNVTKPGLGMLGDVMDELQAELDAFHDGYGVSIAEHFWSLLTADGPAEEVARSVQGMVGKNLSFEDIVWCVNFGREPDRKPAVLTAFYRYPQFSRPIPTPRPVWHPLRFGPLWDEFVRTIVRDAENRARVGVELPGVGMGWVSETRLLNEMRQAFPEETVLHQARPFWLRQQSLDIVFQDRNVAIEYQGVQHSRPVDYFGGEDSFVRQQHRDLDKRIACERNGVTLIEVFPNYNLQDVIATVRAALDATGATGDATAAARD